MLYLEYLSLVVSDLDLGLALCQAAFLHWQSRQPSESGIAVQQSHTYEIVQEDKV